MDSLGVLVPWWFTRFLNDEPDTRRKDRHAVRRRARRSEEHTSELQSPCNLVCRLLLEKKIRLAAVSRVLLRRPALAGDVAAVAVHLDLGQRQPTAAGQLHADVAPVAFPGFLGRGQLPR